MRKESEKIFKKKKCARRKQEQARILKPSISTITANFHKENAKQGVIFFLNANVGLLMCLYLLQNKEKILIVTGSERLSLKKAGKTKMYVKAEKPYLK